jgi:hypothetical protein
MEKLANIIEENNQLMQELKWVVQRAQQVLEGLEEEKEKNKIKF